MMRALALALLLSSAHHASADNRRRRFSPEATGVPQQAKAEAKDRSVKLLAPKFVAEKYGVTEGDSLTKDTALKINDEAQEIGERPPNFFTFSDSEVLLLPEVFSTLNPDKVKRDFADPTDAQDELELRNTRWWGRLYIEGWPQTVQFLRAHFGEPPPEGVRTVLLAEPHDACGAQLDGPRAKWAGAIVVARRGLCTFSAKARAAAASGAAALVLVNNEDGNEHLAGPDAHDVGISVSMVAQADGALLLQVLEARAARDRAALAATAAAAGTEPPRLAPLLQAAMVPIHCAEHSATLGRSLGSDLCAPATAADREAGQAPLEGGWMALPTGAGLSRRRHEFLIATFGVVVDAGVPLELAVAGEPWDTCGLLAGGGNLTFEEFNELPVAEANATAPGAARSASSEVAAIRARRAALEASLYRGKAVVVRRGGCAFVEKAKAAQAAGAAALIIANTANTVSRFGVEPRWKGLGINIPCVMVTEAGGAALVAEVAAARGRGAAATGTFTLSRSVTAAAWEEVETLRSGAAFQGQAAPWEVLAEAAGEGGVLHGWPERLAAAQEGFGALPPGRRAPPSQAAGASSGEL